MFTNLSQFLSGSARLAINQHEEPQSRELQVAVAALLLEMANSDADFSAEELNRVVSIMFIEMETPEHETAEIVEMVEFMKRDGSTLERFIKAINEVFSVEQRQMVLALIWRMVKADGKIQSFETTLATDLRKRLGLGLEQAVFARQMAEKMEIPGS
mgnify:CR=1 FL=1